MSCVIVDSEGHELPACFVLLSLYTQLNLLPFINWQNVQQTPSRDSLFWCSAIWSTWQKEVINSSIVRIHVGNVRLREKNFLSPYTVMQCTVLWNLFSAFEPSLRRPWAANESARGPTPDVRQRLGQRRWPENWLDVHVLMAGENP